VRLAARVFAPHYASHAPAALTADAALRAAPDAGSDVLAALPAGSAFEVLELAGGTAWGVAPGPSLVGYLDEAALAPTDVGDGGAGNA